jgi:hypothetical protein
MESKESKEYQEKIMEELESLEKELNKKLYFVQTERGIHHRAKRVEKLTWVLGCLGHYRKLIGNTMKIDALNSYLALIYEMRSHFKIISS